MDINKFYTWTIIDDKTVLKDCDNSFLNYYESAIPKEIESFFCVQNLKKGSSRSIQLHYNNQDYIATLRCDAPRGQKKITYPKALKEAFTVDLSFDENVSFAFVKIRKDDFLFSIADIALDDETDLMQLKYETDVPIFQTVRVIKKDFSVYELFRRYKKGTLILDADFQRRGVWKADQNSELIESVLMGLPLPIFYFKQQEDATYIVVDGKQRLTALFTFLNNEYKLQNLQILNNLIDMDYEMIGKEHGIYQSQLEDYQLYCHIILPPTPDRVLFDIFDRVNRSGTKLNKMEIRNALYKGNGLSMLKEIAQSAEFEQATRIDYKKDKRMKGLYLLSRSISFNLLHLGVLRKKSVKYAFGGDVDDLQSVALPYLNSCSSDELYKMKNKVLCDLKRIYLLFESDAFRRNFDRKNPINLNMFETIMYFMMLIRDKKLLISENELKDSLRKATASDDYQNNIGKRSDNINSIKARFAVMDKLAQEISK